MNTQGTNEHSVTVALPVRQLDGRMRRTRNPLKRAAIELLKEMLESNAPPAKIARQIALVEAFPA